MNLGYLKKSLERYPRDMDDCEVLVMFHNGEKVDYDCLTFLAYIPSVDSAAVVLGTLEAAKEQTKNGKLAFRDGTTPTLEDFDDGDKEV